MKKISSNLILLTALVFLVFIIILSTLGIETNKFNKLISDKVSQSNNVNLKLDTIKFKINPKELSLFLETYNPQITYKEVSAPIKNIKVYIDFLPLFKSQLKIKKISLILEELDITQLNQLSKVLKPSNFKSLLNNKIKKGKLISEIDIYLSDQGTFKDFIAKGSVKDFESELISGQYFSEGRFNFFADKNDILIQKVFGNLNTLKISEGDIKLNFSDGIKLNSNFNSLLNLKEKNFSQYNKYLNEYKFLDNIKEVKGSLKNNLFIHFDKTYKIKDYDYSISGNIDKSKIDLSSPIKSNLIKDHLETFYLSDIKFSLSFNPNNINSNGNGKYSLNGTDYLKINFNNKFINDQLNIDLNFDFKNRFELSLINYKKTQNSIANLNLNFEVKKNIIKFNSVKLKESENFIKINGLSFKNKKFSSFKLVEVKTTHNNFFIKNGSKILIKGSKFDATNLIKFLNNSASGNSLKELNSSIEIDFKNIKVPMSEKLENFKLLGEIKKGQFVKISSKGDFGGNNFLDISMKKDKNSNKKFLEIYSDLTRPLLTEFSFFNGLSGGKLLFTSTIEESISKSKLKIENFKVVNAPGVIKLLSLADLGGLVDLAEGEGLSFEILEIDMEKNKNILKLNEILALGPSMSVLMEGYQDEKGLTSLRGTLVPAKTLNKMISKIPVIGKIVIPKEAGEGLFGISFKMKGPKGKVKTTINPIRTITPRFIQKIIDREKISK